MFRSHLYDFSDTYIVVKSAMTVESNSANNRKDKQVVYIEN